MKRSGWSALARRVGEVIAALAVGLGPHQAFAPGGRRRQFGEVQTRVAITLLVLSAAGIVTIANRESFRAKPYVDGAGVVTNGYGNTNDVDPTKNVTPDRALVDLLHNTNTAAVAVRRCVKVKLYPYEFDVYVALAVNVGTGAFCKSSGKPAKPNLIDLINAERYGDACDRIREFNKIRNPKTGQLEFSQGLANARDKEWRQCRGEVVI